MKEVGGGAVVSSGDVRGAVEKGEEESTEAETVPMSNENKRREALTVEADDEGIEGDDKSTHVAATTQTWSSDVTHEEQRVDMPHFLHLEEDHTMARVTATAGATRLPLALTYTAPADADWESPSRGCCMELPEEFVDAFIRKARLFFQS